MMASSPVNVEEMSGRGRAMVACRPIKAGEILLRDSPILVYPNLLSTTNTSYCYHCFRSLNAHYLTCPSCSLARFCGDPCRSAALSSSHSPWPCRTLLAVLLHLPPNNSNNNSSHLLTHASFLISAFNLARLSPSAFSTLMSLQGNPAPTASDDDAAALFLRSLICSISPEFASWSPALVSELLAKDKLNAFGLMEPFSSLIGRVKERTVRAYAIYPTASFFNHDCLPNACRFDYVDAAASPGGGNNTDIIVRSIHEIEQGREVCLSYFPVTWAYKERQTRLLEDYGFACECDRCQVEKQWKEEDEEEDDDDENEMMEDVSDKESSELMEGENNGDFPHAYFFIRYVCEQEGCGGTLAPISSSNPLMECNACGHFKPLDFQSL